MIVNFAIDQRGRCLEIKKKTGLKESEVISIMRKNLKKNSYVLWRKRVRGRMAKHRKRTRSKLNRYEF